MLAGEEEPVSFRGVVPGKMSTSHQGCTHLCARMSSRNWAWWERKEREEGSKAVESSTKRCRVDLGGARRNRGEYDQNTLYARMRFSKNKTLESRKIILITT